MSESSSGRQRAGAVLSSGKSIYLGHTGGIGGGKEGIGKTAFLNWYRDRFSDTVNVEDRHGGTSPYIVIGKIADSLDFISSLSKFVFAVEQFKKQIDATETIDEHLEEDAEKADEEGVFQPGNTAEALAKVIRSINIRRGQPDFRRKLLNAYERRCAISGCDCPDALEAAHIRRYGGEDTNHVQNGLLLRGDLHTLFDLGRIGIDPDSYRVVVAKELSKTVYSKLNGKKLWVPNNAKHRPNSEVLREHLKNWKLVPGT